MAILKVIGRHLKIGYILRRVERGGKGYRIDLLFRDPSGRTRLTEVKSSRQIREVHRIQAALYPHSDIDEVAVSNSETDEVLTSSFIKETKRRAEFTRQLLVEEPALAATTYTPHPDVCYTCANSACPYLLNATQPQQSLRK